MQENTLRDTLATRGRDMLKVNLFKEAYMKKIFFLLVMVVLLAACQPAAPPCPPLSVAANPPAADIETLADSISLVIGTWFMNNTGFLDIRGTGSAMDLTYTIYNIGPDPWLPMAKGTMRFENGKLTYLTSQGDCQDAQQATYAIYLVKNEGRVIGMRPKAVGQDACPNRNAFINNQLLEYIGPLFFIGR